GELPGTEHSEQRRRGAETRGYPQNFERQRVRALVDALVGLAQLDLPSQRRDFGCAEQRPGDEYLPPAGQAFEIGRSQACRAVVPDRSAAPEVVADALGSDEHDAV